MKFPMFASALLLLVNFSQAKSWSFNEATLSITRKGAGVGGGRNEK